MDLRELLDELRQNMLRDVDDSVSPDPADRLYSDSTLVRYINDGAVTFATRTLCLRDETTPEVTRVTLAAGQTSYPLDPRVKAVLGARIGTTNLGRTTYASLTTQRGDLSGGLSVVDAQHGAPRLFYTDRETGRVGVWPVPADEFEGQELVLRVARAPLKPLALANPREEPEIPAEFHMDILEWAAWRALRNNDRDIEDVARAGAHRKRFDQAVEELQRASKRLLMQDIQFGLHNNWS